MTVEAPSGFSFAEVIIGEEDARLCYKRINASDFSFLDLDEFDLAWDDDEVRTYIASKLKISIEDAKHVRIRDIRTG